MNCILFLLFAFLAERLISGQNVSTTSSPNYITGNESTTRSPNNITDFSSTNGREIITTTIRPLTNPMCFVNPPMTLSGKNQQIGRINRTKIASVTEIVNVTVAYVGAFSDTVNIFPYAVKHILSNLTFFPPVKLNFIGLVGCGGVGAVNELAKQYYTTGVDCVIGPSCDVDIDNIAQMAGLWNVPLYTYISATSQSIGKDTLYRSIVNLAPTPSSAMSLALVSLFFEFSWTKITYIYDPDQSVAMNRVTFLSSILASKDMDELHIKFSSNTSSSDITASKQLDDIKKHSRVIMCIMGIDISPCKNVLIALYNNGLRSPDYLIILPWSIKFGISVEESYPWVVNKTKFDGEIFKYYANTLIMNNDQADSNISSAFISTLPTTNWYDGTTNSSTTNHMIGRLYDSTKAYIEAIVLAYNESNPNLIFDGIYMRKLLSNFDFLGATGDVDLDSRAARSPAFKYITFPESSTKPTAFELGFIRPKIIVGCTNLTEQDFSTYIDCFNLTFTVTNQTFLNFIVSKVKDPECGYLGDKCSNTYMYYIYAGVPILIILAILISLLLYVWHQNKNKQMTWKLQYETILFLNELDNDTVATSSRKSIISDDSQTLFSRKTSEKVYVPKAVINNTECQYKIFKQLKNISIDKTEALLLGNLKKLMHNNINEFVGIALNNSADQLILLWTVCGRGSLYEHLHNSDMRMDLNFKTAFIYDISNGLDYLHNTSSISFHGNLSCHVCHITSNWIVQITDTCINEMESDWLKANFIVTEVYDEEPEQKKPKNKFNLKKSNDKKKKIISSDDESSEEEVTKKNKVSQKVLTDELLYKAPELLKNPIYPHLKLGFKDKPDLSKLRVDMQYADAYSVGMIFYEILYRLRIFEVERDDMEGLIDVLSGKYYKQTKTPQIPYIEGNPKETNPSIVAILQQCFDNDPSMRPNIKKIKKVFQTVLKIKGNLVDSVISMMDRYAVDLERTVKDRTKMLEDAQERADRLLSQMLPPEVATLLKNGKTFEPRIFKSTSLVFTDICSFTKICAQSSPIQIVTFLNNLFTGYDTIVDKYDAYKISTVGDCYIVLSKENGSMHAKIIASIALAMKGFLDKYTLPHMPTHVMKARWGLHSGPVATGIVGLQAPRYCIFGDTVNIASKMESSGVPSQIQMSVETRDLIKSRRDPFITKKRGQVSVKKNLDWTTYWLLGYTVNETASTDKDHDNTSDVEE